MLFLLFLMGAGLMHGCKKEETPKKSLAEYKKETIMGSWKQKDIKLGVSTTVKVGSNKIPLKAGMSMLDDPTINMLLNAMGGNPFPLTRNNKYKFNSDGTYAVEGVNSGLAQVGVSPIFAGDAGTWESEVFGSVLALFPQPDKRDPHWINSINSSEINLAIVIKLPGLGDVPMNLVLQKQ